MVGISGHCSINKPAVEKGFSQVGIDRKNYDIITASE
jgi:hypothetical protein